MSDATPLPAFADWQIAGEHNANIVTSSQRIMEGKSWLKQDTVILIPCGLQVPTKPAFTWFNMMTPPNQWCPKIPVVGMEVGEAYSNAISSILADPNMGHVKYLMTIEHDNSVPQDALMKLLRHMEERPEFAAISGLYWTKGPGGVPQIWGDPKDPMVNYRPQPPKAFMDDLYHSDSLVECCGLGMGCCVYRLSMFRDIRLRRPWFKTVASPQEGVGTQDLFFWGDARKNGYRCAVACDVKVGHYDLREDRLW